MTTTVARTWPGTLHPIHTILLAGSVPLFLGALLSDIAYAFSYEIQWTNFAAWLITGGLIFNGFTLLCAVVGWFCFGRNQGRSCLYPLLLLITWVLGFINALVHAKDAWAAMPAGLILSIIVAVLICASAWIGLTGCGCRTGGAK